MSRLRREAGLSAVRLKVPLNVERWPLAPDPRGLVCSLELQRRAVGSFTVEFGSEMRRSLGSFLGLMHVRDQLAQLLAEVRAERLRLVHVTPVQWFVRSSQWTCR